MPDVDDGFVFPSLAALQRTFRVSGTTAKEWKRLGLPSRKDGKKTVYPLREVIEWYGARFKRPDTDQDVFLRKQEIDIRTAEIEMRTKELRLQQQAGKLVDREAAKAEQRRQNTEIRSQLEALPTRMAGVFPPEHRDDLVAEMKYQIHLLLKRFAMQGPDTRSDSQES